MDKLLDINQLSRLLSVKPKTIYHWVHIDYIPYHRLGRLVRFSEREVEEWLRKMGKYHKGRKQRVPEVL